MRTKLTYLSEMGIDCWELSRPEKLVNYHIEATIPESSVKLLFVCPELPQNDKNITLLENIAGSFQVNPDEIRHVYPDKLNVIQFEQVAWIWFCGCEVNCDISPGINILHSSHLSEMHQNTHMKRQLWQQIQSCLN